MNPTFEQAKRYGFIFPGARMWATPENRARIAQDAALITWTATSRRKCRMEYPPFRRVPHSGFLSFPYSLVKERLSEHRGAFLLTFCM